MIDGVDVVYNWLIEILNYFCPHQLIIRVFLLCNAVENFRCIECLFKLFTSFNTVESTGELLNLRFSLTEILRRPAPCFVTAAHRSELANV